MRGKVWLARLGAYPGRLPWRPLGRLVIVIYILLFTYWISTLAPVPRDTFAYWSFDLADPYVIAGINQDGAFLYPPLISVLFAGFHLLPLPLFHLLWVWMNAAAFAWLIGLVPAAILMTVPLPFVWEAVWGGNVHLLFAVALVMSMDHPVLAAVFPLTKGSSGVIWTWYLPKRQWRSIATATGGLLLPVVLTVPFMSNQWSEWVGTVVLNNPGDAPSPSVFALRLAAAATLAAIAGWKGWLWLLPLSLILSLPVIWWGSWSVLAAIPRLARRRWADQRSRSGERRRLGR